jgi:hypothetical protein
MLANKALSAAPSAVPVYVEDVFSTYLYTGNSSTQTITNSIDLSTKGGLVWCKSRASAYDHALYDTARGINKELYSNTTGLQYTGTGTLTAFNTNGFTLGANGSANSDSSVSWTFAKQAKFFDVVTYTGQAGSTKTINHNLGSVPGCIIVKSTTRSGDRWFVWHRSISTKSLILNSTAAQDDGAGVFGNGTSVIQPTSTQFTVANNSEVNDTGQTYVAYLFAHDAGGFGASGSDNVISCGSFTTDGDGVATVTLGYEPQWVMVKSSSDSAIGWQMLDIMRGWVTGTAVGSSDDARLDANLANAEFTGQQRGNVTSTGFVYRTGSASQTCIYIAIRRGPMKTPTSGTSVYEGTVRTGTGATASITGLSFPPDFVITRNRPANLNSNWAFFDKLRGTTKYLSSNATTAETTSATSLTSFNQAGETFGDSGIVNGNGDSYINYQMRRAPGFFDVVCYTGTGATRTVTHNLGVAPELMIIKKRSDIDAWAVYAAPLGATGGLQLHNTSFDFAPDSSYWNNTAPTSSVFTVKTENAVNTNGATYVAYLFASLTGVSKVGSYTGTGSTQTINCGFTAGARFVLIKRTDSTGDWYVWDTARGIVSGNDSYLLLNSTAAEVTNTDYIDTANSGFEISSTAPAGINANGGTFIFFAVA